MKELRKIRRKNLSRIKELNKKVGNSCDYNEKCEHFTMKKKDKLFVAFNDDAEN